MRLLPLLLLLAACQGKEAPPPEVTPPVAVAEAQWPPEWPKTGVVVMGPGETDRRQGMCLEGPETDCAKAPLWYEKDFPSGEVMQRVFAAMSAERRNALREGKASLSHVTEGHGKDVLSEPETAP